jgi:hypothetical protein
LWNEARTLSECEAWLDLIQSARFEATVKIERIVGREVSYSRGQYPAAIRFLAKKWHWSERKVRVYLEKLVRHEMVSIDNSQGINVITLTNYEKYNGDTANDTFSALNESELQGRMTQQMTQPDTETDGDTANDTFSALNESELRGRMTQQMTQPDTETDFRHGDDTKKKKDKKEKEYISLSLKKNPKKDFQPSNPESSLTNETLEKEKSCAKKENSAVDECRIEDSEFCFERVWELYGKKGNRKTSERRWANLKNHCREAALKHIPHYVASTPDKQFRKNFETYINQEAWNDEIIFKSNVNANGTVASRIFVGEQDYGESTI